ncbi:MAG: YicC/YloC family endoribonuclease, partial [Verrucomicrobiota bacterium]
MKSMTGFGRATAALGSYSLCVQVSSVNRKTLDLTQKLPADWADLETDIADQVRKVAARGKVHVAMELTGESGATGVAWDDAAVQHTLDRLRALCEARSEVFTATPDLLWSIASAHRKSASAPPLDDVREAVLDAVAEALRAFVAMRAKEGEALLVDFFSRLETLSKHVHAIAERAPKVPANYREQLMKRLRDAGLELDLDDDRVL